MGGGIATVMRTRLTWFKQDNKRTYEVWLLPDNRLLYRGPSFLSACKIREKTDREIDKLAEYNERQEAQ